MSFQPDFNMDFRLVMNIRTIKETSFIYQDKRGFFLLSRQKTGRIIEKRALERSIGCCGARFLRSAAKEYRNRCCTHRISLPCKQLLNVFRRWDSNLMFAKKSSSGNDIITRKPWKIGSFVLYLISIIVPISKRRYSMAANMQKIKLLKLDGHFQ